MYHIISYKPTCRGISKKLKYRSIAFVLKFTHALLTAEKAAIPARKIRKHTEIPGFSKNRELVKACQDAKFWFSVWREGGRPKSGVLNCLRKHTKCKFEKALKQHRTNMKHEYTERIINDPSRLWKDRVKDRQETPKSMPCDPNDWRAYYTS